MKDAEITRGTLDEIAKRVGLYVKSICADAVDQRGEFRVALSGGSALSIFSRALLDKNLAVSIDWTKWQVFWADERWVPLTSEDSNYQFAKAGFLDYAGIPAEQIHPYNTALNPRDSALAYENEIKQIFLTDHDDIPAFDLIVLGIGADGHTASLFPDHPVLAEKQHLVAYLGDAPKSPPVRLTFSLPLINQARHIAFIVTGSPKKAIVAKLLKHERPSNLPARLVSLMDGEIQWFVDDAAW